MTNQPERSVEEIASELTREILKEPNVWVEDLLTKTLQAERQKRDEMVEEAIKEHFTGIGMVHLNAFCKLLKSYAAKGKDIMYIVRRTEQYPFVFETKKDVEREAARYLQALTQPNNPEYYDNTRESVEEIVEEFTSNYVIGKNIAATGLNGKDIEDWLTQTIQTERQRCEEMVERIARLGLSDCDHKCDCEETMRNRAIEALTHPNNK